MDDYAKVDVNVLVPPNKPLSIRVLRKCVQVAFMGVCRAVYACRMLTYAPPTAGSRHVGGLLIP